MYNFYNITLYRVFKDRIELLHDRYYRSKSKPIKDNIITRNNRNYKIVTYITKLNGNFKESLPITT